MKWFRMWHGFWADPKLIRFSPAEKYALITLYYLASESGDRGTVTLDHEDIAAMCGCSVTVLQELLHVFQHKSLVTLHDDGAICIPSWDKWQPKDEASAARARAYRANKPSRSRHGTVTPASRYRHARVTTDTDTDTDTNTPLTPLSGGGGEVDAVERLEQIKDQRAEQGKPKDLEEVLAYAQVIGCPEHMAMDYYGWFESTGWRAGKAAHPIRNWRLHFSTWWRNKRSSNA